MHTQVNQHSFREQHSHTLFCIAIREGTVPKEDTTTRQQDDKACRVLWPFAAPLSTSLLASVHVALRCSQSPWEPASSLLTEPWKPRSLALLLRRYHCEGWEWEVLPFNIHCFFQPNSWVKQALKLGILKKNGISQFFSLHKGSQVPYLL